MSAPRRSLGPVIAYMLTLLGLVLAGIWVWDALHRTPAQRSAPEAQGAAPRVAGTPPNGETFSAAERQQLENVLRQKSAGRAQ